MQKKIKECNKKYQEQNAKKLKEYQKEYHEQMQKREQILQNTFNNKDPDQIINTIIESEGHCNLKLLMMNSKNDPNKQEQMNFLLQILKENPILQDKIIEHLKNKRVNYCGDKIFYIVQLFETDETNYGLKYKRSKELFEYLKICPYFFRYNRDFETQMKSFLFYIKKLLMEEDFRALLLSHKYFYLDDQLQSFRILENFVEKNDKILTQKYFDILANDPEMENWIVKLFQTRTNSQKFLFFEAIKQNQIEIVQIILNFFVNYCSKNENFEILIKMLDDPTYSMSLEKMPVLPFTIKQKNMRMAKLLMETMLKIPNYKLKNLIMLDDQTIIQSSNFDLITMPIAFLEMLNKANSDVEKFLTITEVYMILREQDIKKNLKLLQLPDTVTKWNLIRLCFMMKSRNKLADKI